MSLELGFWEKVWGKLQKLGMRDISNCGTVFTTTLQADKLFLYLFHGEQSLLFEGRYPVSFAIYNGFARVAPSTQTLGKQNSSS